MASKRPKLRYELIDNMTGKTLVRGVSSHQCLLESEAFIRDNALEYSEVSYLIIANGKSARIAFRATGAELAQLIEDEGIKDTYENFSAWE